MKLLFLKIIVAVFSVAVAKGLWFLILVLLFLIKTGPFVTAAVLISEFSYFGWLPLGYLSIFFYVSILEFFIKSRKKGSDLD